MDRAVAVDDRDASCGKVCKGSYQSFSYSTPRQCGLEYNHPRELVPQLHHRDHNTTHSGRIEAREKRVDGPWQSLVYVRHDDGKAKYAQGGWTTMERRFEALKLGFFVRFFPWKTIFVT